MKFRVLLLALVTAIPALRAAAPAAPEPTPRPGSTYLFYGAGMVERLLEEGFLEAGLQLAYPELGLRVRSLAWTGDEVAHRRRPEGYSEHLKSLLAAWPADVVVLGYGFNESFAGTDGLVDFRRQYEVLLGEMARRHPGARLVLLAPHAVEERSAPPGAARNADVAAYAAAVRELAAARGARFIDLFATSREAFARAARPLTDLGVNLNPEGARVLGLAVAAALAGPGGLSPVEPPRLEEVARAAARRHAHAAELVRPKNGALYYGVRRRPEEAAAELPRYHELVRQAEATVHALAKRTGVSPVENLPPLAPGKVTPYRFPGGAVRAPADLQAELVVAEGYAVNLFASEEQFPELRNPVQLSFDARGRLWVVTMPSFPHTIPGERPADKILVLEDRDRDGRADTCTVFAEGLDALDGVAFHERGVIVSAQPRLLVLQDTDGDGRADTRTELLRGVDVTDSHHGGMVVSDPLGHLLFCDGVFHRSQFETPFGVVRGIDATTYRLDPRTGRIGSEWQSQTPNPWKISFTAQGQPIQRYGGGHVLDALPLTWTPLGVYHAYGHGTVLNYAKGSALAVISSPNFPPELQQGVASAALLGSYQVSLSALRADDGPLTAASRVDVLTSKNSTFRPVDVEFGLDGALYVSDFSSLIIGHAQHAMRDPQWNHERGRIWRVVHRDRPVARDWPRIEGAGAEELAVLLGHPQDLVRHHARIGLRRLGAAAVPAVEQVADSGGASDRVRLEACWVLLALGEVRPAWLDALARSPDPLVRAAVPALVRFGVERLPDAAARLGLAAADPHPRVRMAAVNAVAHLRPQRPALEAALSRMPAGEPAVARMREDLKAGTAPRVGRAVPVLEVAPETRVGHWEEVGAARPTEEPPPATGDTRKKNAKPSGLMTRTFRTFVEVTEAQPAVLGVRHGFLDVSANGVQVHAADSQFSSEQQVEFPLRPGLNEVRITFRRLRAAPPPVFLYDPTGRLVPGARLAPDAATLASWAQRWEEAYGVGEGVLRVQAVPNQMQFAPAELRVRAGQPVRILFENPDLMPHNLLLTAPDAAEEVGALADAMAAEPGALARHYVPASPLILHATPLVEPGRRAELAFTAPATPGRYPYLCTFPGHWRMMRGILIVE
jgi:lysophospholipase L1-like esterase/azurin